MRQPLLVVMVPRAYAVTVLSAPPRRVPPMQPALSPSRAADFLQCPMLYRFRVVDRLPEPPSRAAARLSRGASPSSWQAASQKRARRQGLPARLST